MTLLITIFAAVISTAVWYMNSEARKMKVGTLCCMYWGASLMWLVDAVVEYMETGAEYFTPDTMSMINDGFLGLSVAAFGLVIWLVIVLVKDPNGIVKKTIMHK
ncbi:MAG: hypothetical protein ACI4JK_13450 [Oscillospiraceae bacterium]